ncbi:hypothetical protein K435DRAFT_722714 [Dendrothele bispora CBS 962.96]|uniref:Fibronectin type-III domain-containing protein n=1 Tax=Dendrothele bispora (strain CBS 962.96) TaxID=1314807 RepID=A0A4S8M383_DENBC|nr:hypothetical protein K435DRAFT_722714 [Dendrothele bispora CBS 962.96]
MRAQFVLTRGFWFLFSCATCHLVSAVTAEVVPSLDIGFTFDYDIPGQPIRVPTTAQCETIHLKWQRGNAQGLSPMAPYFMQIYTSTFITPFTIQAGDGSVNEFDYQVPFAPGTRYQICMYDSLGTSGGCQEMYTMIPNITTQNPQCKNVTFPPLLGVEPKSSSPPGWSQFGFPDQCTDISIKPVNGTPPFILTISPPLHPPFNITSSTMDPIDWTVSLGGEIPFFVSLVSSEGFGWSNGPLHAGLNGPTGCLAPGTISKSKAHSVAAGAGLGGLFGGLFLAGAAWLLWTTLEKRKQKLKSHALLDPFKDPYPQIQPQNQNQIPSSQPSSATHDSSMEISGPMIMGVGTTVKDRESSITNTWTANRSSGSNGNEWTPPSRMSRGRAGMSTQLGNGELPPPTYSYADHQGGRDEAVNLPSPPVPEKEVR